MVAPKTHSYRPKPRISARYLADFMAATETARRTIVRDSKYQPRARVIQHEEARATVAKFIRAKGSDVLPLLEEAARLKARLADNEFDRDLYDHNADYIMRFAEMRPNFLMADAEISSPGTAHPIQIEGVTVTFDLQFRLRRVTKTNKILIGAGMLRYSKGKPLPIAVAQWQSALILGYLKETSAEQSAEPHYNLCITVDAYTGLAHEAPTDSVRRYGQIKSACATIAERWPNVPPPNGAIF
jgi:hypothetical protein